MYYSKSHNGFFPPELFGENMPEDAVQIEESVYASLMGRTIGPDENGHPVLVEPVAAAPLQVTARQCELALLDAGLLDDVEAAVSSLDRRSQIEWRTKTVVERNSPLVQQLGESLRIDLDELFTAASIL